MDEYLDNADDSFESLDTFEMSEPESGVPMWVKVIAGMLILLLVFWLVASLVSWL